MGAADRTIQHLHLRAPSAQAAVRAVHRLEDALRCASLPDAGERVLLVRRLHLGRLPEGLSSQSLSLLIEKRVAAVGGEWVHGGDQARAAHRDSVFFTSRLQAAQAALRRRANGQSLDGWYWPLALPGVALQAEPANFLAQLVVSLCPQPGAPALLVALAIDAVEHGHAQWLRRQVGPALAQQWVALAGAQGFMPAPTLQPGACAGAPGWGSPGVPVEPIDNPETHAETDWLGALVRANACRSAGPTAVSALLSAPIGSSFSAWAPPPGGPLPASDATAASESMALTVPETGRATPVPVAHRAQAPASDMLSHRTSLDSAVVTQAGGLWFLLPQLERLGFADWQALHAERPVLALILRQALRSLRVPHGDPAWAWVDSLPCETNREPHRWSPPSWWPVPAVHLHQDPLAAFTSQAMARCWLIAVRRQLRHDGNLSLADLCRRPARLRWSRTHVDVAFARNAADVRVRRLGLDIDPGWVPWLGRVVVFVYGSPEGEDT